VGLLRYLVTKGTALPTSSQWCAGNLDILDALGLEQMGLLRCLVI